MSTKERGSALLTMIWLSAALTAIAFSVATTVRGEIERAATASDGAKGYFLARGALDRALLYVLWQDYRNPDGSIRYWAPGVRRLHFEFPNGVADVDFIPEASKLNVNLATPEELLRMLDALGVDPARAQQITAGILDWRTGAPNGLSEFDSYYLSLTPSFRARHASMEEIEEVELVKGMTPQLFHGSYFRDTQDHLIGRSGLKDCLSVYSNNGAVDANTAPPAVMAGVGLPPDVIAAIVARRKVAPFSNMNELRPFVEFLGPVGGRLIIGGGSMTTLRATARLRLSNGQLSDLRRTVGALVKFAPTTKDAPYHILRWYDQAAMSVGEME